VVVLVSDEILVHEINSLQLQAHRSSSPYFATVDLQYSETNVMNFIFSLLRINDLYMFRALLAYPQEELHKRRLVYCVHVLSADCPRVKVEL
jgi:hypothetical protein